MSSPHELYVANADLIERTITSVCRRHQLFGADAEDLASVVRLHLIEDNYAVLQRFEGRSSLRSFLIVVITRQFQDWRNARWGKWRPSAEAKRLGETAVRLETLTVRDGLTLDEANELLRSRHQILDSRASLEAMAARFPVRHKRLMVDDSAIEMMAAPDTDPEARVVAGELSATASRATGMLGHSLKGLPPQDQLILRMRFTENMQISEIAKALHLEAKPLYRRIEKVLESLRGVLEASGLTATLVTQALDAHGFDEALPESGGGVRPFVRSGHAPALTGGHRE
jgi:RNA polymerase sigma factor for flagellar operon FliA